MAPDLRNNGLPLYLSRPFSRTEYVLGKMTVLVALMSAHHLDPGAAALPLPGLSGGGRLAGGTTCGSAPRIFIGSWAWILVVSLVALAISAWVKWKPVARISLLIVFFVLTGFARALNETLDTWWGYLLSLPVAMSNVWASCSARRSTTTVFAQPVWAAWLTLAPGCALALWLLSRRIRAYEVVR